MPYDSYDDGPSEREVAELRDALAAEKAAREKAEDGLHHCEVRLQEMCAKWTDATAMIDSAKYMVEKARACERAEARADAAERALAAARIRFHCIASTDGYPPMTYREMALKALNAIDGQTNAGEGE